ncbi:unnamed protein product [Urochloa humidicola]
MVDITDKSAVSEENQVAVPEDKLKEEQKKEYDELVDRFKCECLKSYSINRSGELIKKFNIPSFQPLMEAQRENKLMDAVGQAVAQAFIKSATVMGNTVHNVVVKTFAEGTFPGCMGPCYIQPDQMQYVSLEISMAAALSAQNSQAGTSNSQSSPQVNAGYGMHPDFFSTPPKMQFNASASQPIAFQPNPSAVQPKGTQQDASAVQLNAQGAWSPQQMAQTNASAPPPMTPQQRLAILLQPQSLSKVLLSQSPHQKGVNWVFHNQATGQIRCVSVPYMDITRQQSASPSVPQPTLTQQTHNRIA